MLEILNLFRLSQDEEYTRAPAGTCTLFFPVSEAKGPENSLLVGSSFWGYFCLN